MYKILCPERIEKVGEDYLLEKGYVVNTLFSCDPDVICREIGNADAMIVRMGTTVDARILNAATKLKIIARHGVGYDNIDVKAAEKAGIYVTNARGANTNAVAEQAITLILAIAKRLPESFAEILVEDPALRKREKGCELRAKTLGLIGLGANGSRLAKIAHDGFEMNIIGYDPYAAAGRIPSYVTLAETKEELLQTADIVSLHCMLTPDTEHYISEKEFRIMKPEAWLINCARGRLVDEAALYNALLNHQIAAAGVDTFEQEPPQSDNPLFTLANFVGTLHRASNSVDASNACALYAAKSVDDALCGRKPDNLVNAPDAHALAKRMALSF